MNGRNRRAGRVYCGYLIAIVALTGLGLWVLSAPGGPPANDSVTLGRDNVYIPTDGRVFVAPSLVIHYIDAHHYQPPDDFQAAVLNCPEMRSMAYLKALDGVSKGASSQCS